MIWVLESVVIFVTFLVLMLGVAWWQNRPRRVPLERLADPAPLPGELPHAGRFDADWWPDPEVPPASASYGLYRPFPDTGPLLLLSEKAAANVALEREIEQRCVEAEAKIPPRWRS